MARTVKEQEYATKRNEILDVAQRFIYTKGYEQMTIQDILDDIRISRGAFYHYFESKSALLEALIKRMLDEAVQLLTPIVQDPHLTALEKLHHYFDIAVRWKTAQKTYLLALLRVWYADDNAVVRQKIFSASAKYIIPMINGIILQGIQEGVLNTSYPKQIGEVFFSIFQGLGDAFSGLLLSDEPRQEAMLRAESIVAAYTQALERTLGAPIGSLHLMDTVTLKEWFLPSNTNV